VALRNSAFILTFFLAFQLNAQDSITFVIKNAGINVDGIFLNHTVTQRFDPENLQDAFFKAEIDVNSLNTGIKGRDKHLKKEKYFFVDKFPVILFESSGVTRANDGFLIQGELNIKGTKKQVEIPFTLEEIDGKQKFQGYLEIDRRDYNVGKNHLIMGDLVKIYLSIENRNSL